MIFGTYPAEAGPVDMSYFVYIIYSDSLKGYYVGSSENIDRRIEAHNVGLSKYTRRANDWRQVYQIALDTKKEALILERKIKKEEQRDI